MPPPTKEDLWKQGRDETVEVNQRALIDKILARYSGEHTIFRELLQNADDAGAEHVQVKFYTQSGLNALDKGEGPSTLPDVKKDPMVRYTVMNDGIPFRPQDWQRLKKIAEGNPDEEKIGAFGVGFYSLWSVCDDPFVESGDKWMGFYWKDGKDQLLARSGDLPPAASTSTAASSSSGNPWTSFTMTLREPTILEGPLDLARFFVTSLTFMRSMKRIDMLVDDVKVLEVTKSIKGKERVYKKGLKQSSAAGMMSVAGVDATGMVITASVMKWLAATGFVPPPLPAPIAVISKPTKAFASFLSNSFFNRSSPAPTPPPQPTEPEPPEDPTEVTVLNREIKIYQADIKVSVSTAFGRELERATKKAPPTRMPASLVFSRSEEEDDTTIEGKRSPKDAGGVFAGLCPTLDGEKSARVFIGQATSQTTGIGGHLAARFIPTVERESIDMVDRHVSQWNRELLWVGGYLSRMIYELEMLDIQQSWATTSVKDTSIRDQLLARALHTLRFFTYKPTTPSSIVGQEMESAFFSCHTDNKTMPILSNAGILPINAVRMPNLELQKFLPDLPTITALTLDQAPRSIARLRERSLLREVTFDDVIKQLGIRPLNEQEMIACLAWWQSIASADAYTNAVRARLLDAAVLVQDDGKIIPLSTVQTYVKPQSSSIPTDMPLPSHTLPYSITKDLKGPTIYTIFGWTELWLNQYIEFLVKPPMSNSPDANPDTDIRVSPIFAERVLGMLGRAWQSINANQQTAIAMDLKEVACIPTKEGFKKPGEAYFEKNLLFDDLPTITLPKTPVIKGGMEKMLLFIGVRRTVNLQLVFSRMVGGGTWSCQDLMKYLVSVRDTLSTEEMARLRQTAAFPLEQARMEDGSQLPIIRQKPHQLYEPVDAMRSLGLPILDWGEGKWRSGSDEAKMLFSLGLRRYPPVDVLLGIAAGRAPMNEKALQYLLSHTGSHYVDFNASEYSGVSFIPAKRPNGEAVLAKPGEVFTNPDCAILGFAIADPIVAAPENAAKLGIPAHPPVEKLVAAFLRSISTDIERSRKIFEYLSTKLGFSAVNVHETLRQTPFVPVKTEKDVKLYKPNEVYFRSKEGNNALYASAFTFIDFGDKANVFLRYCGVRAEPSVKDIASLLIRQPQHMLSQAGSAEKYLEQLRLLAANWNNFDHGTKGAMRNASFVLASRHVPAKKAQKSLFSMGGSAPSEEDYERVWILCRPSEVSVIDNITLIQYFGKHVLAAPEEGLLERFYGELGARTLSSQVRTEYMTNGQISGTTEQAKALRKHVLERLTIFLAEARRKQSEYTVEWLSKEGNFKINEVRQLSALYTLTDGRRNHMHEETLYATAEKARRGNGITLTVSVTAQPDDYDIASALCSILLKAPKADDALLLYSILSTPLMALKKRGFHVDRILNQQREERMRLQAEATRDREKAANQPIQPADVTSLQGIPAPASIGRQSDDSDTLVNTDETSGAPSPLRRQSILDKFRKRRSSKDDGPSMPGGFGPLSPANPNIGGLGGVGGLAKGPSQTQSTKRPTDLDSIRRTVQTAVNASRPENSTKVHDSRQAVRDVSESQNDYCDTSAKADIVLAIDPGRHGLRIWVPSDVPNHQAYLADKLETCQRFATEVLIPIGQVFKLGPQVLNIFWDHEGPLIAFNKNGTIYCNARYYKAWHDTSTQHGQKNDAYISWYFSIAHEIAHNLESAHNASHEFYFSSIAEEYLVRFAALLKNIPSPPIAIGQ